jgi:hypothetical protein
LVVELGRAFQETDLRLLEATEEVIEALQAGDRWAAIAGRL